MITDDEVMRVLEQANPASVDDPVPMLDVAGYRDVLDARNTAVTLIDNEPTSSEPTSGRRWLIPGAAAAVVVVAITLVVTRDNATPADQPSPTVAVPVPAPIVCEPEGCPWSPELTAQRLDPALFCGPPRGAWCLGVSPEGTLVVLDPVAETLTWYEDVPRVVPLTVELDSRVGHSWLVAIGPHDIAYLGVGRRPSYIVAVAPSGEEIKRVNTPGGTPSLYPTATGLSATPAVSPNGELWVPWVDLDRNPITDTKPYPTATVTDAGIEVRHEEREWLVTGEPWSDDSGLEIFPRTDGGVVLVLFVYGSRGQQVLELSTDGTIERYFLESWPFVLPDGSWIVEHNAQLVRLTPPA